MRKITIIGGGLGGLALANGLRCADVPVEVLEAGRYPRHRVCGEFMAGLNPATISALGLESCLTDALQHRTTAWFRGAQLVREFVLPEPVMGISRLALDERLAQLLRERGGHLQEGTRGSADPAEGSILTCGRMPRHDGYVGLKGHWSGIETQADLELHLGRNCYVGLSAVESGHINVCGLFSTIAEGEFPSPLERFHATLSGHGLGYLADRLAAGAYREGSFCSVSGLQYSLAGKPEGEGLGDRQRLIPPFTGNGMTIAIESALEVLPLAIAYAKGEMPWPEFMKKRSARLHEVFNRRYLIACLLHPFILQPALQSCLCTAAKAHLVPFKTIYRLTHASALS
jgi:flavin-dependent dehydrogenase